MANLLEEVEKSKKKQEYNNEPVFYCTRCLSLKIMSVPHMENSDFCDDCNGTDIAQASIEEWEQLYQQKYGHKYLESY